MTRRSTRLQLKSIVFGVEEQTKTEKEPDATTANTTDENKTADCSMLPQNTNTCEQNCIKSFFEDLESSNEIITDSDMDELAEQCANQIINEMNLTRTFTGVSEKLNVKSSFSTPNESSIDDLPTAIDISCVDETCAMSLCHEPNDNTKNASFLIQSKVDKIMQKSVIKSDFETRHLEPAKSWRSQKKARKQEKLSTTGHKWFNMKAPEMTEDVKRDLEILQMRSVLDPKRFYKHNDKKTLPKYFQIGRIMDNSADFYSSRVPKKMRKQTLAEELLADAEFKRYQKKKFGELMSKRKALGMKRKNKKRPKLSL